MSYYPYAYAATSGAMPKMKAGRNSAGLSACLKTAAATGGGIKPYERRNCAKCGKRECSGGGGGGKGGGGKGGGMGMGGGKSKGPTNGKGAGRGSGLSGGGMMMGGGGMMGGSMMMAGGMMMGGGGCKGGFQGQSLHMGCADCIMAGANPQCCAAALKHGNPMPGVMKGYYINNCCKCNQPECGGKNEYPTGTAGTCTATSSMLTGGS
jgi:hypothetical protein